MAAGRALVAMVPAVLAGVLLSTLGSVSSTIIVPAQFVTLNETSGLHPCRRECSQFEKPKTCYYHFRMEYYYTLSMACYGCPGNRTDCFRPHCVAGDGMRRGLVTVNRQMPGPPVEVCEGDTIVVDLENHLGSETSSIHWHGMHQEGTQHMDGVPHVTQCPQLPGTVFRYTFRADNPGTHFWHSHSGFQRSDGAYGALTIRQPKELDVHGALFDTDLSEHLILLTDWIKEMAVERFVSHHHSLGTNKPETILINGRGRPVGHHRNSSHTPLAEFVVKQGLRHRLRLISNGVMNCPLSVSVDNHTLTVIASDGYNVQPELADSVVVYAGERYDVILTADQPPGVYWMKVQGLMDCDERYTLAHQVAVVRYEGAEQSVPEQDISYWTTKRDGRQVSPFNDVEHTALKLPVSQLKSLHDDDVTSAEHADVKFYLDYDFNQVDNKHFHHRQHYSVFSVPHHLQMLTPQFNNISMQLPMAPPLSQPDDLSATCNASSAGDCQHDYCECTHVLHVPLGAVVELFFIDRGFTYDANHPLHLHGYAFRVVAMERFGSHVTRQEVIDRDRAGLIPRRLHRAPLKDTVTVPDGGYTAVRFHAKNPGWWLFHCHMNFHAEVGMALIFHVGEKEHLPKTPEGFPTCGGFMPHFKYLSQPEDGSTPRPRAAGAAVLPSALLLWILFLTSRL
ncbi:laccase-1-like isoform X2 [Amphibalanus amphitrite]|uniref:laccase-1-like isoform X2 n=1 Tax=Amphibalanus amphitrite TaxID=1232801 RepID=UPI001C90CCBA|nr:laccase-1-like isoform X2 [Amphibalanus amphitrite]